MLVTVGSVCGFRRRRRRFIFKFSGMRRCDGRATHDVILRLFRADEWIELNEVVSSEAETHDECQDEDDLWC